METEKVFLVICGTLVLVLIINAGILMSLLRPGVSNQFKSLGRAMKAIRDPWGRDDKDIKELHQRISELEGQSVKDNDHDQR